MMSKRRYEWLGNILFPAFLLMLFTLPIGSWKIPSIVYQWLTSLDGNNTVYDYNIASVDRRVNFMLELCYGGKCLTNTDVWCGFYYHDFISFSEEVEDCFDKVMRVVPVYTKLDKIRMICGRHYLTFDPLPTHASPEQCKQNGGIWGEKLVEWRDADQILSDAGVW